MAKKVVSRGSTGKMSSKFIPQGFKGSQSAGLRLTKKIDASKIPSKSISRMPKEYFLWENNMICQRDFLPNDFTPVFVK